MEILESGFCGGNGCDDEGRHTNTNKTSLRRHTQNYNLPKISTCPWMEGSLCFLVSSFLFPRHLNFFPSPASVPKPKTFWFPEKSTERGVLLKMLQFRRETRDKCTVYHGIYICPSCPAVCIAALPRACMPLQDCAPACGARDWPCSNAYIYVLQMDKTSRHSLGKHWQQPAKSEVLHSSAPSWPTPPIS